MQHLQFLSENSERKAMRYFCCSVYNVKSWDRTLYENPNGHPNTHCPELGNTLFKEQKTEQTEMLNDE